MSANATHAPPVHVAHRMQMTLVDAHATTDLLVGDLRHLDAQVARERARQGFTLSSAVISWLVVLIVPVGKGGTDCVWAAARDQAFWRSSTRLILPVRVFGRSATNSIRRG